MCKSLLIFRLYSESALSVVNVNLSSFHIGGEVNPGTLLMLGAWQFSFRYTGWERRGRLDLWSQAVQPRRKRIMQNHMGAYYYLMLVSARTEITNKHEQLIAVILPVLQRVSRISSCIVVGIIGQLSLQSYRERTSMRIPKY